MTRAKVDFYTRGQDAMEDATALCEVGIERRNVAAVWACADQRDAKSPWGEDVGHRHQTDFGTVRVMGWLTTVSGRSASDWSAEIVRMLDCGDAAPDMRTRIESVLTSGGGLVAVRTSDDAVT